MNGHRPSCMLCKGRRDGCVIHATIFTVLRFLGPLQCAAIVFLVVISACGVSLKTVDCVEMLLAPSGGYVHRVSVDRILVIYLSSTINNGRRRCRKVGVQGQMLLQ
jgi:hypothetical protein